MKPQLPSQERGPLLNDDPRFRRQVFWLGNVVVGAELAILAIGLNTWRNGPTQGFLLFSFGGSAVFVLLFLGLYAMASSQGSRFIRAVLPVRGRWARYCVVTLLWFLGLMAFAMMVLMPVA